MGDVHLAYAGQPVQIPRMRTPIQRKRRSRFPLIRILHFPHQIQVTAHMPQIIHSHPPAGQRQSTPLRIFQTRKDIPHTPLGMRELDTAIRGIIRAAPARRHIHGMTNRNLTDHPIRKQSRLQTLIRHTPPTQTPGNQMDRIRLSHMPRIRIHIHAMRGPHQNPRPSPAETR